MPTIKVGLDDFNQAREILKKFIEPTPLLLNRWISDHFGCQVYLKLENMQPIGAFKIRGAINHISRLSESVRKKGVISASAGNHAQGVAWAAAQFHTQATIVMPASAPITKIQNTRQLGAKIILHGESYDDAYAKAQEIAKETGMHYVPAYEDADIISGQGTAGLEILDLLPDPDYVIGPLGGGGLMAGVATAIKLKRPTTKIIACQASGAKSLVESLRKKKIVKMDQNETFADGIRVKNVSQTMLNMLLPIIDETADADDEAIAAAVLLLMERAKVVAEGAGALPLAILETLHAKDPGRLKEKKVVLIISGGNIDVNVLSRIIDRGLIRAGRRIRINVFISDRPGSLAQLTQLIATMGGSIIQVIHDRSAPSVGLNETGVELTIETRGQDHSEELVESVRKQVHRLEFLH